MPNFGAHLHINGESGHDPIHTRSGHAASLQASDSLTLILADLLHLSLIRVIALSLWCGMSAVEKMVCEIPNMILNRMILFKQELVVDL